MARARNPKREEALQLYLESNGQAKLKDIAVHVDIPDSRIRKWKTEDKWDDKIKERSDSAKGALLLDKGSESEQPSKKKPGGQPGNGNAKGHGAPLGNDNAKGNNGGAPIGNKNALISGKYERIFKDCLDEEEQESCAELNTDELAQINLELELLTVRERRMMKRIQEYSKKKHDIEERITEIVQTSTMQNAVYDEKLGMMRDSTITAMVPKEIVQMKKSTLDKLLRIESHLTDIQAKKTKAIEVKHRIALNAERLELERRRVAALEKQSGINEEEPEDLTVTIVYE